MKEFIFTWFIENISYSWHKPGEWIDSPKFIASSMQNTEWILRFYPRGRNNSDYLSLYLFREKDEIPVSYAISFELSCLSADLSTLHSNFIPETFTNFDYGQSSGFGESCFIKRYEVFDRKKDLYLPKDIITMRCRMWKDHDEDDFGQIFGRTVLPIQRIISVEKARLETAVNKIFHIQSRQPNKKLMSVILKYNSDNMNLEIIPQSVEMKTSTFKFKCVEIMSGRKVCEHISCFFDQPGTGFFVLPFSEKVRSAEKDTSYANNFEIFTDFVYSTGEEIKIIKNDIPVRMPEFLSNYILNSEPDEKLSKHSNISRDVWNMFEKQILCDVKLETRNKTIFVHRIVLCARSPVFLAILTSDMKEKMKNCIDIEDISADTLEKFLKFLYTDAFEDFEWDTAAELYYAADKYQVESLKFACRSYLMKKDVHDKVCELLILAERHQDFELMLKVHDFIWRNEEKVFKSSKWKEFAIQQPQLAVKTMLSKYEERDNPSSPGTINESKSTHSSVLDDFRTLYRNQIINDIVIKTKGTTFPAHKTVLGARSPSFKDILTRTCEIEPQSESIDFIEIEDLEEDIVSLMLIFLYTDSLEAMQWDNAEKLYRASVVYQIQKLKVECSRFLLENLDVTNASHLLLLAHEHGDWNLKTAVEDFIHLYDEKIFGSDEWVTFGAVNPVLAFETMCAKYRKY